MYDFFVDSIHCSKGAGLELGMCVDNVDTGGKTLEDSKSQKKLTIKLNQPLPLKTDILMLCVLYPALNQALFSSSR